MIFFFVTNNRNYFRSLNVIVSASIWYCRWHVGFISSKSCLSVHMTHVDQENFIKYYYLLASPFDPQSQMWPFIFVFCLLSLVIYCFWLIVSLWKVTLPAMFTPQKKKCAHKIDDVIQTFSYVFTMKFSSIVC